MHQAEPVPGSEAHSPSPVSGWSRRAESSYRSDPLEVLHDRFPDFRETLWTVGMGERMSIRLLVIGLLIRSWCKPTFGARG